MQTQLNLEVIHEGDYLIVIINGIDTIFKILKPELLQQIIKDLLSFKVEAQVYSYTHGLLCINALSL